MQPPYFEYHNPVKILCGENALDRLPSELRQLAASRPMLLTDAVLQKLGLSNTLLDVMDAEGCPPACTFTDIPVDSSLGVVNRIAALYREKNCDSLLALGGGSVIDTAKGVHLVLSGNTDDILSLSGMENIPRGRHIPFIVVPTTAGTGSECTGVAVIRNEEQAVKMEFLSPFVAPDAAVLDPRMTLRLPPRATAATGMDALCHAIEAYSCLQKNPLSDAHATASMRLVAQHLLPAVENGADATHRLCMALAATLAGIAFSNSMVGAMHAIGHALGGVCHLPHADVMAVLLPHVMRFNLPRAEHHYAELLPFLAGWEEAAATPKDERARAAIRCVENLTARLHELCGLPVRLRDMQVREGDFPRVAQTAINDGALIVNPASVSAAQVEQILHQAY